MLSDDIKVEAICEIRPVELSAEEEALGKDMIFSSSVKRVNLDGTIDMSIPVYNNDKVDLERNRRYSFLFIHPHKMMTAHGVFLQRIREDNVQMIKIKLATSPKKLQRRDYFRVGCRIDMSFQVISMRLEEFSRQDYMARLVECIEDHKWRTGTILDISGGGMKFTSEEPIMDLPFIYGTFFIGEKGSEKRIGVTGKILSRNPVPRSLLCTYRVKFIPEHTKAQDTILAYVNSQQLVVAKKETGR